jgi:hypothetical protein
LSARSSAARLRAGSGKRLDAPLAAGPASCLPRAGLTRDQRCSGDLFRHD